jgi:biopolymer transport protein ExbD
MRSSRRVFRELERNELANRGEPPINLVPMIDILTTLVLYLLVGTIFRQFAVLQLNLPGPTAPVPEQRPALNLTVTLRQERLEVSDRGGTVRLIDNANGSYDLPALANLLADIKRKVGDSEDSVTLLLEPNIKYDALVQVMDAVRLFPPGSAELTQGLPMFPAISIGDALKSAPRAPVAAGRK